MSAHQESPGSENQKDNNTLDQISDALANLKPGELFSIELPAPGLEERESHQRVIAALTSQLDELSEGQGPEFDNIILLTSNSPIALDPELQARLGKIRIELPDPETRAQIIITYAEKRAGIKLDPDVASYLASKSDAVSPLVDILSRAAESVRESGGTITREMIDAAMEREA